MGASDRVGRARRSLSAHLPFLPFVVLAGWVFAVLARVFLARLSYPLDLEWMEGGVLTHALRLSRGQPLYAEPSVDFVSFLYTPLYPAVPLPAKVLMTPLARTTCRTRLFAESAMNKRPAASAARPHGLLSSAAAA